jgi:hypothetical protein
VQVPVPPHDCPFIDTISDPATQEAVPVAHDKTPFAHGSGLVHEPPPAQLQLPLPSQALSAPFEQAVPAGASVLSLHTG